MRAFLDTREGRRAAARTAPEAREFMRTTEAWRVVSGQSGGGRSGGRGGGVADRCGLTAHRGVLHPDEWLFLDDSAVVAVERKLGFTVAEIRGVYRRGRLADSQRESRARVDARMLEIAEAGGNMTLLARMLGYHVSNGSCSTIANALTRARKAKEAT